jgi:hypothetical protein
MINIDKDYLITIDLKNTKVKSDKTIFFYNTDLNICNIFIKLICSDEDKTIPEDLIVEFAVLKPETDEFKPLDATLISKEDLLYQVDLTTDYFDIIGKYECEIRVSGTIENELKCFTSEEFNYVVRPNITAKLNKKIKNDKNLPILEKLIKDVKEVTEGINKNEIQMKRDENLVGDNKTIVGAINQLREDVDSGTGGGTVDLKDYQKKNDEFLNTDEKTITGGINEVNNKIKKVQESQIELDAKIWDIQNPFDISSISLAPNISQMGSTVSPKLTWNYTHDTIKSQTINNIVIENTLRTKTFTGVTATTTYILVATSNNGVQKSKTSTITFANGVYYGKSTTSTYNNALISGLTKQLSNSKNRTITVNAGVGEYIFYCIPSRLGACSFNVGGFDGGFSKVATINFTNSDNYVENYDIYKSDNANLGNTNVTIK